MTNPSAQDMPMLVGNPLVLVVDDTAMNRSVTCILLEHLGCRSIEAADGPSAIAAIADPSIELVLMDCQMPGMDGFQATAAIRRTIAPGRRLPIIALTGTEHERIAEDCRKAGMDDHVAKPMRLATLQATIMRWLGGSRSHHHQKPPSDAVPILDPSALASYEHMRAGSGAILLGIFIRDLAPVERMLGQAIADGDLETLSRAAHKLKGAAATVGARALSQAMRDLEAQARTGSLPASHASWQQARTLLAETRQTIAAYGTSPGSEPALGVPPLPGGRASVDTLAEQQALVKTHPTLTERLNGISTPSVLLNADRQIVAANQAFVRAMSTTSMPVQVIGRRVGEVVGCIHAEHGVDGCGTAPGCGMCDAVRTFLSGLRAESGRTAATIASIDRSTVGRLTTDLEVEAVHIAQHRLVLVTMHDAGSGRVAS